MRACGNCGRESPDDARFCPSCGSPLADAPERRKLATLLFCDISGSTALGERVDPESVRDLMRAYFDEMRAAIERHGGTVEKFIGDAVMAAFGVPTAHEDDALRACRAAIEMRQRLERMNDGFEARYGAQIALRIGVNTGEVVAGDASLRQSLVTGDAVNVAARLEQAAAPGEVLVGEDTWRLVRGVATGEAVAPLTLKGKSQPLAAWRLIGLLPDTPTHVRRLGGPTIGRSEELARLRELLVRARSGETVVATIVGEPGVGKSRLADELIEGAAGDFRVLSGRCLAYGEGITYWPIGEVVRQAAGILDEHGRDEALARLEALLPGPEGLAVAQAVGLADGRASTRDIAEAVAVLVARLARDGPVMVFVDDIHWAEPALLDLLADLPSRIGRAPVQLLYLARPELTESHPEWPATVRLAPLATDEGVHLAAELLGRAWLQSDAAQRISTVAAGNPLFIEEIVGMLADDDARLEALTIPPTLRELLGARLDRMPGGQRGALERGAVEGQVFHAGAVAALSDPAGRSTLERDLAALFERDYVHAAPAVYADESAFRIRHLLIRDAAYEGIPKKRRAAFHEAFADWLEEKAGDRATEVDEILGYHLEQAYRYHAELGPVDDQDRALAGRAAEHLERAGRRALDRRDAPAIVNLLRRAADLLPPTDERHRLELLQFVNEEVGYAGDFGASLELSREIDAGASTIGDALLAGRARLTGSLMRFWLEPDFGVLEMLVAIDEEQAVFERSGHPAGIARSHDYRALTYVYLGRFEAAEAEAREAMAGFEALGESRFAVEQLWYLTWTAAMGPLPVEAAIRQCHDVLVSAAGDQAVEGHARYALGRLEARRERFDEARRLVDEALAIFERVGMLFTVWHPLYRAEIEILAGGLEAAERELRRSLEDIEAVGLSSDLAVAASRLASLLVDTDRLDEAADFADRAARWAPKDQPIEGALWRAARARVLVRRGEPEAAEALARESVALAETTDYLDLQGEAYSALADVLGEAGRQADADAAVTDALERYARKSNRAATARLRQRLSSA